MFKYVRGFVSWNNLKSVTISPGNSLQLHQQLLHLPSHSRDYLSISTNSKFCSNLFVPSLLEMPQLLNFSYVTLVRVIENYTLNFNTHRCLFRKLTGSIKPEPIFLRSLEQIPSCNDSYISRNTPTPQFNLLSSIKLNQPS